MDSTSSYSAHDWDCYTASKHDKKEHAQSQVPWRTLEMSFLPIHLIASSSGGFAEELTTNQSAPPFLAQVSMVPRDLTSPFIQFTLLLRINCLTEYEVLSALLGILCCYEPTMNYPTNYRHGPALIGTIVAGGSDSAIGGNGGARNSPLREKSLASRQIASKFREDTSR